MTSVAATQLSTADTTLANSIKQKSKPRKSSDKDKDKDGDMTKEEKADRLKTVVRRLPPNLPEEVFWQSVQPWVTEETASWKVYHPGKIRKRPNKESIPSRAYIAFRNEEQLATFSQAYDGHLFRDKAGNESIAVVEFAPYQKIPSDKKKADARCNTIDRDEDYISFIKSLENKGSSNNNDEPTTLEQLSMFYSNSSLKFNKPPSCIATSVAASQPPPQPKTTPLLEALKAQKEKEQAIRIQIKARDVAASNTKDNKKDTDKKAAKGGKPVPQTMTTAVVPESIGKKGKKAKAAAATAAAAANASATQAKVGPSGSTGSPATAPSPKKPAKSPRPPRPLPAQQPLTPAVPNLPIASDAQPAAAGTGGEPAQPRRTRPIIASRGLEAALSGAGLGKRRAKEKAGDAVDAASGAGPSEPAAALTPDAVRDREIQARKDRDRERERKRRENFKAKEPVATSSGGAPAPTILAAPPKILARPAAADGQSQAGLLNVAVNGPEGEGGTSPARGGGGGGRRGRGRGGRGRGGGPQGS
ncbi:hypothetical protein HWV62_42619 [Athelia sp. TMB]|nr:hypothetical protein HWV62_42619 [Athelia sp. TMB]